MRPPKERPSTTTDRKFLNTGSSAWRSRPLTSSRGGGWTPPKPETSTARAGSLGARIASAMPHHPNANDLDPSSPYCHAKRSPATRGAPSHSSAAEHETVESFVSVPRTCSLTWSTALNCSQIRRRREPTPRTRSCPAVCLIVSCIAGQRARKNRANPAPSHAHTGAPSMLLTISTTHEPATDLGFLLHKNPDQHTHRVVGFGTDPRPVPGSDRDVVHAALIVDVDPIGLRSPARRSPAGNDFALAQYVNDRPYAASSFLSVALAKVFGTAMSRPGQGAPAGAGRHADRARRPSAGGPVPGQRGAPATALRAPRLRRHADADPARRHVSRSGGRAATWTSTLSGTVRLQELLEHLLVLMPGARQRQALLGRTPTRSTACSAAEGPGWRGTRSASSSRGGTCATSASSWPRPSSASWRASTSPEEEAADAGCRGGGRASRSAQRAAAGLGHARHRRLRRTTGRRLRLRLGASSSSTLLKETHLERVVGRRRLLPLARVRRRAGSTWTP